MLLVSRTFQPVLWIWWQSYYNKFSTMFAKSLTTQKILRLNKNILHHSFEKYVVQEEWLWKQRQCKLIFRDVGCWLPGRTQWWNKGCISWSILCQNTQGCIKYLRSNRSSFSFHFEENPRLRCQDVFDFLQVLLHPHTLSRK